MSKIPEGATHRENWVYYKIVDGKVYWFTKSQQWCPSMLNQTYVLHRMEKLPC